MLDNELDTIIDDVAQAMTAAPPDSQLAHRVALRIAGLDAPRERSRWMQPWILVPAAGICALLVAVVVVRENSVRLNTVRLKPDTTEIHANANETPAAAIPDVARGFQPRVRGPERAALHEPAERAALQMPAIAPLQLDAIDVAPVALNGIDINPIAIDRIDISAMP